MVYHFIYHWYINDSNDKPMIIIGIYIYTPMMAMMAYQTMISLVYIHEYTNDTPTA